MAVVFLEMMMSNKVMSFMMTAIMMAWKGKKLYQTPTWTMTILIKRDYIRHLDVLLFDFACFSHCVRAMVTKPI